jgi:hypothetical protein
VLSERWTFHTKLAVLLGIYLLIELAYVYRLPLAMDEFQFASESERLQTQLPYRDFRPYKNMLGYYLLGAPLSIGHWLGLSPWTSLLFVKFGLAITVPAVLMWSATQLRSFFAERSVLAATALLVVMSTFLERSAVIRMDMLASLFGLAAAIHVLNRRPIWAGSMAGLGFLATQKAAYFVVAAGLAFSFDLVRSRGGDGTVRRLFEFGLAVAIPLLLYFATFAALSSPTDVWQAMFVDSSQVALWNDYQDKWLTFWIQTVIRNPVFYAAAALGLAALTSGRVLKNAERERLRTFSVYAVSVTALCIWHKQPWPYFFVMLIPTAWICAGAAFDAMTRFDALASPRKLEIAIAVIVVLGTGISGSRIPTALARSNVYQRHTFEALDAVVGPDETYVAGANLLYHRPFQPIDVRWLDRRQIAKIEAQSPEEREAMFERLEAEPIKVLVRNYRTNALPAAFTTFLEERYMPLYGFLSTYAPVCPEEGSKMRVTFPGTYRIIASAGQSVSIDGRTVEAGKFVGLSNGIHTVESAAPCRLHFIPRELETVAEARFVWGQALFFHVYTY